MRLPSYTESQLELAVRNSSSFAGVIRELGLAQAGGTQKSVAARIELLGLDISHFTGQAWNSGRKRPNQKAATLRKHLQRGSSVKPHVLRLLLIETGTRAYECERCRRAEWEGEPMPLELHHIDGDRTNNTAENLQILCPNCHALTPNHAGKALRRKNVV